MPLTLLVNPSSAGGKTLKLLPRVEQALDARRVGLPRPAHQGPRARRRAGAARDRSRRGAGGDERRRPGRRGRRRDGRLRDAARDHPRRPRQRPRPGARHPRRARGGGGDAVLPATAAGSTSARPTASASSASSASASTPKPTGSPTRPTSCAATSSTPTPPLRTLLGWKPARFTIRVDEERIRLTGYSVSVANSKAFGGGMYIAPDAELDDGEFDIVAVGEVEQAALRG